MAESFSLGAIGQIALTVSKIEEAEAFYRDVLGLPHLYTFGNLAFFDCAGTRLFLSAAEDSEHAGNHSVIYFQVESIQKAHQSLLGRGVNFVEEPQVIHTHADGTQEWMAFFNDPSGNVLALMSQVPTA